jgi:hypothetical protein
MAPLRSSPRLLLAACAGVLLCASPGGAQGGDLPRREARAGVAGPKPAVALEDFVAALEPLGEWVATERWGRAWRPRGVESYWRPYFQGRWAPTEAGWYWVSDEPWGWATYHFGRWILDPAAGWLWLPGRRWAPSWVIWRQGNGLLGWAPLGPDGRAFAPTYVFAPAARILEPVPRVALVLPRAASALGATRPIVRAPAEPRPPAPASPTAWSSRR